MTKFKKSVLDQIAKDPELYAKLASTLRIRPGSVTMALKRNGKVLNQYHVVNMVAEHLNVPNDSLVEEVVEGQS